MTATWVTLVWGMVAAACLTLSLVHLLTWSQNRGEWAALAFSVAAASLAGIAGMELTLMLSTSPHQASLVLRWSTVFLLGLNAGLICYVHFDFRTGRRWLGCTSVALRALSVVLAFTTGESDVFRTISRLETVEVFGDPVSVIAEGVPNPWIHVGELSSFLMLAFVLDASIRLWKRGGREDRRRACVIGGSIVAFLILAIGCSALIEKQVIQIPYFISFSFLPTILVISFELSRNLSRMRKLADEVREGEAMMNLAADSAGAGLWAADAEGNCLWLTDRTRALFGFAPGEIPNWERFRDVVFRDDRERVEGALRQAMALGVDYHVEFRTPDGEGMRWIASQGRPYPGLDGKPNRLMGASIDVTSRKKAEDEARQHTQELAHVSRVNMVGELSGSLVHELGQPLGAILANAETALLHSAQNTPDREEMLAILTDIREDSLRAGEIIHGLRTFLRRQQLEFTEIDLTSLFLEVERLTGPDAAQRHTRLNFHADTILPRIRGHRVQLQQVLLNLILNGLQAMEECPHDERQLSVTATQRDGDWLEIVTTDSGKGLPPDTLEKVFTPFITTKSTGLGMGLSICRRIIEAHGGTIHIENNADRGATVRFTLPIPEAT